MSWTSQRDRRTCESWGWKRLGQRAGTSDIQTFTQNYEPCIIQEVIREHYNIPIVGTCIESLVGGNHFR